MNIPEWNHSGILPPFIGNDPGQMTNRSPYKTNLFEVAKKFGASTERKKILSGLIDYRKALRSIGIDRGIQWLNGSFTEDCESLLSRSPNDIDVVTFINFNIDESQAEQLIQSNPNLFIPQEAKKHYYCDGYFVYLSLYTNDQIIQVLPYWYGLFSHQRKTHLWKGIVEISLNEDDSAAMAYLESEA